jgi:hypothetical protein
MRWVSLGRSISTWGGPGGEATGGHSLGLHLAGHESVLDLWICLTSCTTTLGYFPQIHQKPEGTLFSRASNDKFCFREMSRVS